MGAGGKSKMEKKKSSTAPLVAILVSPIYSKRSHSFIVYPIQASPPVYFKLKNQNLELSFGEFCLHRSPSKSKMSTKL
jgi:hypothetical protein